jgi:hypothetical protein
MERNKQEINSINFDTVFDEITNEELLLIEQFINENALSFNSFIEVIMQFLFLLS